jgi:protein TonB
MSSEERMKAEPCAGGFSGCLVDGDTTENARERKIKRRALGISVVLQSAGLAVLVIAPLFAKPAELTERLVLPIPPYRSVPVERHNSQPPTGAAHARQNPFTPPTAIAPRIQTRDDPRLPDDQQPEGLVALPLGSGSIGPIEIADARRQPPPPREPPSTKRRISEGHIDPALLTWKIEPVYPPLARQLHKSGRVELRAIIGTDGSVQSLEVVSGDPLFILSAREAVSQWRYRPTYLNGQAVEVDTYISVIYTLQR